jgi:hypothetical protein
MGLKCIQERAPLSEGAGDGWWRGGDGRRRGMASPAEGEADAQEDGNEPRDSQNEEDAGWCLASENLLWSVWPLMREHPTSRIKDEG